MKRMIPISLLILSGLAACDGGYLVRVQDSGSDGGLAYLYDTSFPDTAPIDSNQPVPIDAAVHYLDAGTQDLGLADAQLPDTRVEDAQVDDARIGDARLEDARVEDAMREDSHIGDSAVRDAALPDTSMPDNALPDTFVPECEANSIACDGDHLVSCGDDGRIVSSVLCYPFGCNAGLVPNACRACDPTRTQQCIDGRAVTCSSQGEVVVSAACDFGCNEVSGVCNSCQPGTSSCIDDAIVICGDDGLAEDNPQTCEYGCGLHLPDEDGCFAEDASAEDVSADAAGALASIACNACRPSTARCAGDQSLVCDDSGEIAATRDCAFGCNASTGECRACDPAAVHQCLNGQAVTCSASGEIAVAEDCAYGCDDSDGLCDACDPDLPQQCQGDDAVSCSATGEVTARVNCGAGQCNPLAGQCNVCQPGQDFCADTGDIMACEADGSIGALVSTCTYGCSEPVAASPICRSCEALTTACHGDDLVVCDSAGNIDSSQACAYGCAVAAGDDRCMECTPSTSECHGDDSVLCSPDGYVSTTTNCAYGCRSSDGLCNDCVPDSSACQGKDWVICDATGHASSSDDCASHGDQCNAGVCGATGCALDPAPKENNSCDDGKFCTATASCQSGLCIRQSTRVCDDDNNPCTQDSCDDAQGANGACVYDPAPRDGLACEDGQVCTVGTTCNNGNCEGGEALDCSDGNPCTEEHCEEPTGCTTPDSTGLENTRCGDESSGEEKICCSGECIDSDASNCGQCGTVCQNVGACSATCMHYVCIEPDMLIITELMIDPDSLADSQGEWIEVYNLGTQDIDIGGWTLKDSGSDVHEINQSFVVPAGQYRVIARSRSALVACNLDPVYEWGNFLLGNNGDEVILEAASCEIDRVEYDSGFDTAGVSQQLSLDHYADDNNDLSNWCNSEVSGTYMSCGGSDPYDIASPGAPNAICP